jgi:hypothetical protein
MDSVFLMVHCGKLNGFQQGLARKVDDAAQQP